MKISLKALPDSIYKYVQNRLLLVLKIELTVKDGPLGFTFIDHPEHRSKPTGKRSDDEHPELTQPSETRSSKMTKSSQKRVSLIFGNCMLRRSQLLKPETDRI